MPKSNAPTSQWRAHGAQPVAFELGHIVQVSPGVYTLNKVGPPDAYFVESAPGVYVIDPAAVEPDVLILVTPKEDGGDRYSII